MMLQPGYPDLAGLNWELAQENRNRILRLSNQNSILELSREYIEGMKRGQVNPVATTQLANLAVASGMNYHA